MPDAPDVSFLTRYVLEQPLPVAAVLVAVAGVLGFVALRDGRRNLLVAAGAALLLAIAVYVTGQAVETSGEKAEAITKQFVRSAVAGDSVGAMALFSDDAVLTLVSPTSEALSIAHIRSGVEMVARRYAIDDNRITQLRGYTVSGDRAVVHMTCMTTAVGTTAQTQWVLSIEQQPDGSWKIDKLTWVNVNRRPPSVSMLR